MQLASAHLVAIVEQLRKLQQLLHNERVRQVCSACVLRMCCACEDVFAEAVLHFEGMRQLKCRISTKSSDVHLGLLACIPEHITEWQDLRQRRLHQLVVVLLDGMLCQHA